MSKIDGLLFGYTPHSGNHGREVETPDYPKFISIVNDMLYDLDKKFWTCDLLNTCSIFSSTLMRSLMILCGGAKEYTSR